MSKPGCGCWGAGLLLVAAWPCLAQAPAPETAKAQRQAMKKLDFWVGQWKGTGAYILPSGRREFTIHESNPSWAG